jgi:acetyl esterase/lipase
MSTHFSAPITRSEIVIGALCLSISIFFLDAPAAAAQSETPPAIERIAPPSAGDKIFPLYSQPAQGPASTEDWGLLGGQRIVWNVTVPTLEAFLPPSGVATGAAVVIAPGGAFMLLSYDMEGVLVAKWLAEHGVAAFVLKYRLEASPHDPSAMMLALGRAVDKHRELSDRKLPSPQVSEDEPLAAADAAAAVRLVRSRAAQWGIDPRRVGFLGFSAGAVTATSVATAERPEDRPAFVGVIYGTLHRNLPSNPPPAFIATASDDPVLAYAAIPMFELWRAAGASAELHLYERGGHGFGLIPSGSTSDHWLDEFYWWMRSEKMLQSQ